MSNEATLLTAVSRMLVGSPLIRLAAIAGLTILFLVPIAWIGDLVVERMERRDQAVVEVSRKWGATQAVIGPASERFCLLPGGASRFKLWGIDNFLALGARPRAARPAARFVIVLGPDERPLRAAIDASPIAAVTDVLDTPTLGALVQAILASRATIANDCGPAHVAHLLDVPYVGLFANHRGQAERIARQWFRARPNARWVAPPTGSPITAIRVEDVETRLREVIR